ncbi:hypothetical protein D6833_04600 [Candidatus Parcubacteria bacterium]|nr:MAG: hypothetical protein D6833_04600 [Candidatus Parcubacteria bacterium]
MRNLVHLRRLILARTDSRIDYVGAHGKGSLLYCRNGFHGTNESVIPRIRGVFLANQTRAVKLNGEAVQIPQATVPAVRAIVAAAQGWELPDPFAKRLVQFAGQLPPVSVRLAPLHRAGFQPMSSYMEIHRQMINKGACRLDSYLREAGNASELDRRLRTFLVCFSLGLIAPAKPNHTKEESGRLSVLARIIQRVRGL